MSKNSEGKVHTNNTWGNIDYSPLAPTDTLNTDFSPGMVGTLVGAGVETLMKGPEVGAAALTTGLAATISSDIKSGTPSVSVSITGHEGDTFGQIELP